MARKTLTNKPLVEAVLEVKRSVPPTPAENVAVASISGDPHCRLLPGRFSERLQAETGRAVSRAEAIRIAHGILRRAERERLTLAENEARRGIQLEHE